LRTRGSRARLPAADEATSVRLVELPEDKGTYILIVSVAQMKRLEVGRLGAFDVIPGFYACVVHGTNAPCARAPI